MTNLLAQFILAARNNRGDGRGWVQILIFVILAAFYGLGGLLKAKAAKKEQQWGEEDEFEQPQPQIPQTPTEPRYKPLDAQPEPEPRQQRPYVPAAAAAPKTYRTVEPAKPAIKKIIPEIKFEKLAGLKKKKQTAVKPKVLPKLEAEKEVEELPQPPAESIFNIEETDELRRAIIYTEILGKPIALR